MLRRGLNFNFISLTFAKKHFQCADCIFSHIFLFTIVQNILTHNFIVACHLLSTLLLCPDKFFYFMTDNDASAENNCEEQQRDESQPQTQDKQLATNSEAKSSDGHLHPEDPNLPDRSSQSSFASIDGAGK